MWKNNIPDTSLVLKLQLRDFEQTFRYLLLTFGK